MTAPKFTHAALENLDETGADWQADLARLNAGEITFEGLLEYCLKGADENREEGWRDYVTELADHRDTREAYLAAGGTVEFEQAALAIGNEFLPPHARTVRDGGEPTPDYWNWLLEQLCDAQREAGE
jgi:hypothetical protein